MMNWKEYEKKRQLSNRGTILGMCLERAKISTSISVRMVGVPDEFRIEPLQNTSLDCYRYANLLGM
jgi:hypothetical protein